MKQLYHKLFLFLWLIYLPVFANPKTEATAAPTSSLTDSPPLASSAVPNKRLWNLQDADIRAVIAAISKETGKNFMVSPKITGKITITSARPLDSNEAYQVFLSALELLGYAAVPDGDLIRIVPNTLAKESAPIITTPTHPQKGNEMIVQVVKLENVQASQLAPILQPLMPTYGQITAYAPTNTLIISGAVRTIERVKKIIRELDQASQNDIDLIRLRYASADKTVELIKSLQQADQRLGKVIRASLVADDQHNTILMTGSQDARLKMRVLISELDTPTPGGSATRTIGLNHLKAEEFAPVLAKIAQSAYLNMFATTGTSTTAKQKINIEAEKKTNTIIISAPGSLMKTLLGIIAKLDRPARQVLIEAVIAEVDESTAKKLGTTWTTADKVSVGTVNEAMISLHTPTKGILQKASFSATVAALLNNGTGDILSRPSTVVLDNQKASISVGQNISIRSETFDKDNNGQGSPVDLFKRQDVALKLDVTPQISPNNSIQLEIDLVNDSLPPGETSDQPTISTSKIQTTVRVKTGNIVVLGGLMRHNITKSTDKIPVLGDLPLVKGAFRKINKSVSKKELLVFIRPIILDGRNTKQIVREKYNHARQTQLLHHYNESMIQKGETPLLPVYNEDKRKPIRIPRPF